MQNRQLQYYDITQKCDLVITNVSPQNNLHIISSQRAFVLYKDYLYYIDKESPDNKCIYLTIDNKKIGELRIHFKLNDILLSKDETRLCKNSLSSEDLSTIFSTLVSTSEFPSWLHKILFLSNKVSYFQNQVWEMENEIISIEQKIKALEDANQKKFLQTDLEKIYPDKYKKSNILPTDYLVKLNELDYRLNGLPSKATAISQQYNTLSTNYRNLAKLFQSADTELVDYCKQETLDEKFRKRVRIDINKLTMESRIKAVSIMPGAISLSILMDIFAQLKVAYEKALIESYISATGSHLDCPSFEDLYLQVFKKPIKDRYKEFAKRPTSEMVLADKEFFLINQEFWRIKKVRPIDNDKLDEFNKYFYTLLYLSSCYETFRFTDKVQRLNIASVLSNKFEKFFSAKTVEDVADEFLYKLTALQVQNSFAIMPHCSTMVTVTKATNQLWLEALIWLHGFHHRALSQVSPQFKQDNKVDPLIFNHLGDDDDRQFFENKFPLVKWSIAQYHEHHYKSLLNRLPNKITVEFLSCMNSSLIEQKNTNDEIVIQEFKVGNKIPVKDEIVIDNNKKIQSDEIKIDSCYEANNSTFFQSRMPVRFLFKNKLIAIKDLENFNKFTLLDSLLKTWDLNADQISVIETLKPQLKAILKKYIDSWFTSYFLPTFVYFFQSKHLDEVKLAYENINNSNNPKDYIHELYNLWSTALADNSTTIGPAVEKLLIHIFDLLLETAEPNPNLGSSGLNL